MLDWQTIEDARALVTRCGRWRITVDRRAWYLYDVNGDCRGEYETEAVAKEAAEAITQTREAVMSNHGARAAIMRAIRLLDAHRLQVEVPSTEGLAAAAQVRASITEMAHLMDRFGRPPPEGDGEAEPTEGPTSRGVLLLAAGLIASSLDDPAHPPKFVGALMDYAGHPTIQIRSRLAGKGPQMKITVSIVAAEYEEPEESA